MVGFGFVIAGRGANLRFPCTDLVASGALLRVGGFRGKLVRKSDGTVLSSSSFGECAGCVAGRYSVPFVADAGGCVGISGA